MRSFIISDANAFSTPYLSIFVFLIFSCTSNDFIGLSTPYFLIDVSFLFCMTFLSFASHFIEQYFMNGQPLRFL